MMTKLMMAAGTAALMLSTAAYADNRVLRGGVFAEHTQSDFVASVMLPYFHVNDAFSPADICRVTPGCDPIPPDHRGAYELSTTTSFVVQPHFGYGFDVAAFSPVGHSTMVIDQPFGGVLCVTSPCPGEQAYTESLMWTGDIPPAFVPDDELLSGRVCIRKNGWGLCYEWD